MTILPILIEKLSVPRSNDLALRIYQSVIDGSSDAINLNDYRRYERFYVLPHIVETFEGRTIVDTPQRLEAAFESLQVCLGNADAAQMVRTCETARFEGAETIHGLHLSFIKDAFGQTLSVYTCLCTMRWVDETWRIASSQYAEGESSLPSQALRDYILGTDAKTAAE